MTIIRPDVEVIARKLCQLMDDEPNREIKTALGNIRAWQLHESKARQILVALRKNSRARRIATARGKQGAA